MRQKNNAGEALRRKGRQPLKVEASTESALVPNRGGEGSSPSSRSSARGLVIWTDAAAGRELYAEPDGGVE